MPKLIEKIKERTRWDRIPNRENAYRLLCDHPDCSLSCANLKDGRLLVTSVHGEDRHSYQFRKNDMFFATLLFLDSLSEKELEIFFHTFNKLSEDFIAELKKF